MASPLSCAEVIGQLVPLGVGAGMLGVGKKYETQCKEYIIKCTFMHKGKITQITARNPVSCGAKILLFIGILINLFLLPHCLIIKIAK